MKTHVGELIRTNRERTGWTQTELARLVDYDQAMVSRVESGKQTAPAELQYRAAYQLGIADGQMKICFILDTTGIAIAASISRQQARLWLAFIADQNTIVLEPEESDELLDLFMGPESVRGLLDETPEEPT